MAEALTYKELNELIIEKSNLREYLEKDGIYFKNTNQGGVGLCPFHQEKTGSFNVFENTQRYYCFGCHKSGNIIHYVMETEGLDYKTAILTLAERFNIQLSLSKEEEENRRNLNSSYRVTQVLGKFFEDEFNKLSDDHPAKKMITDRGLNYKSVRYGYAPENTEIVIEYLNKYIKNKEFSNKTLESLGYFKLDSKNKPYFPIRNRLMFYFQSQSDKIEGFTGRALTEADEQKRKYANSSNSLIYKKSREIYNLNQARKHIQKENSVYLVEGQFDVAAMIENGYENVVAISGTALDKQHINKLKMIFKDSSSGKFILCLDDDKAGRNAAKLVFEKNPDIHRNLYVTIIPEGKDPCEYLGKDKDKKLPPPVFYLDYIFNLLKEIYLNQGMSDPYKIIDTFGKFLSKITDKLLRESYIERLSTFTLVDKKTIISIIGGAPIEKVKLSEDKYIENGNYFDKAIYLYINNRKYIKDLQLDSYPTIYQKIITSIRDMKVIDMEKFNQESPIIKVIQSYLNNPIAIAHNEDEESIQIHYNTLVENGRIIIEKNKREAQQLLFKQKMSEAQTPDEIKKAFQLLE